MKQRVCYTMTNVPSTHVSVVRVPAGKTMYAGQIVTAEDIDAGIADNFQVRVPAAPTAATIVGSICGIVVNGGFDQLSDGRRVAGQPDFSQYEFNADDVVTIVWLLPKTMIYISDDCLAASSVDAVGDFITPTVASMDATGTDTEPGAGEVKSYLKILAKKTTRSGGQFGGGFITGSVCEVVNQ